jgi:hypothetical protein
MRGALLVTIEGGPHLRLSELARLGEALSQCPQATAWQLSAAVEAATRELSSDAGYSATHM